MRPDQSHGLRGGVPWRVRICLGIIRIASIVVTAERRSVWRRQWEARFDDPLAHAETLWLDEEGCIADVGRHPTSYKEIEGQYVGLTRVAASHTRGLVGFHHSIAEAGMDVARMDMTSFLQVLLAAGWMVQAAVVDGGWLEVDSASDLELYRALYAQGLLDTYWRAETGTEVCEL